VWALVKAGLLRNDHPIIADVKVGSSEAGSTPTESSHHPVRAGVVRPFQLTGHRHEAEVRQALDCLNPSPQPSPRNQEGGDNTGSMTDGYSTGFDVRMAVTSVEMVRGVSAAVHVTLPRDLPERDLWSAYRATWQNEPFVRIVHEKMGIHRHPEPRLLAGTNYADVGWEYDPATGRAVLLCALDNLGKGAAGSAVQCMNLMCGFDETTALTFGGIYP
jgi:N-acetyl-gamma-glutamyl-phosphate/LysW-gamma-L-alpha-aminoadipyl-6-phosphate reductase